MTEKRDLLKKQATLKPNQKVAYKEFKKNDYLSANAPIVAAKAAEMKNAVSKSIMDRLAGF